MAAVLLELDENEEETGRIAGFEVVGFLGFTRWDALPDLSVMWQLPGWEPLSLPELLQRKQRELHRKAKSGAA
jgi:hypothetical protein